MVTTWLLVAVLIGVLVVLLSGWLSWTATRVDRANLRCEAARATLERQLLRRAALAADLVAASLHDGLADPASQLLLGEAAGRALQGDGAGSWPDWLAESELTDALHVLELPDPARQPLVTDLAEVTRTVSIARRIHNDLVTSSLTLRGRRRVRWFRLAGHSPAPAMIDFDDRPL